MKGAIAIALAIATVAFTACGGDDGGNNAAAEEPTDPLGCLEQVGLEEPEQRDSDLWRAFDPVEGTIVTITLAESPEEAESLANTLPNAWSAVVRSYFVQGPARPPAGTSTRGEDNVEAVADCLGPDARDTSDAGEQLPPAEAGEYFQSNVKYDLIELLDNRGAAAPVVLDFSCDWSSPNIADCSGVAYDHAPDLGSCGYELLPCGRFQLSVHAVCADPRGSSCEYPDGIKIGEG